MITFAEASFRLDEELAEYGCTRRDIEQVDFSIKGNGTCIAYCFLRNGDAVAVGWDLRGQPLEAERVVQAFTSVGSVH